MSLASFLLKKGVEYAPFDPKRFQNFYNNSALLRQKTPKIVQIVGTNGKGTTGRFLAWILKNAGFKVGHFTSPHILSFTERFWFDGRDADEGELEEAFCELVDEFGESLEPLSYFEILTLLSFFFFKDRAEMLILEAGVGGEYDSTTVFAKELLLVTAIGLDHQEMLGDTIDKITQTKLRASNCKTIVGRQADIEVYESIKKWFFDKDIEFLDDILTKSDRVVISECSKKNFTASYLEENLALAYVGARYLGVNAPQLETVWPIGGRFERVASNIIIDVGHNELAAKRVANELGGKKVTLIFNCYADKDPYATLLALKDSVECVEIIAVPNDRIIKKEKLIKILDKIGFSYCDFDETDDSKEYLVFGSFSVVSEFLRRRRV